MNNKIVLLFIFVFIISISGCGEDNLCGDGVCDTAEQGDPELCPEDCEGQEVKAMSEQTGERTSDNMFEQSFNNPHEAEIYLAFINTETDENSAWEYSTSFIATAPTGEVYDQGAFCRIFPRTQDDGYDFTYGANMQPNHPNGYSGIVHKQYTYDFEEVGETEIFNEISSDYAIDTDGEYYYLLMNPGYDLVFELSKFTLDFELVDMVIVPTNDGLHRTNDQMIRAIGDYLYISDEYYPDGIPEPPIRHYEDDIQYTEMWTYTKDLELVERRILDEWSNAQGETLVYYDDTFAHVTADRYKPGTIIAMLYDSDWNYIETLELQDDARWSQGGIVDDDLIYIAYEKGAIGQGPDAQLDIYDFDWNLQETIVVTNLLDGSHEKDQPYTPVGRPWVQIDGDRMLVSFDMKNSVEQTLVCAVIVYERK